MPAVYREIDARDPSGFRTTEKTYGLGNVIDDADAADGHTIEIVIVHRLAVSQAL